MKTHDENRWGWRVPGTIVAWMVVGAVLLSGSAVLAADRAADQKVITAQNMPLGDFVNMLSQAHRLNVVAPKNLQGTVSVNFFDVPPMDALGAVLEANGYRYALQKTAGRPIVRIEEIPKVEGAIPVDVRTFALNYSTAEEVGKACESVVSKNGRVTVASGRNAVIVQDVEGGLKRVTDVVKLLDAAPKQVMIDAKIVELSKSDLEERGINWGMFQDLTVANLSGEAFYSNDATYTRTRDSVAGDSDTRALVRTTGHKVDLRAGILSENAAALTLDFFDSLSCTTVISRPSIRTLDNKAAHIISGQIVPIPLFDYAQDTGVKTLSGFQDEQVGVELTVTPHINEDGFITLDINPKVESIDRFITVDGDEQRPVKNTRQATTTIRIRDGQTAVIGGLTSASNQVTRTGLPWLRKLPWIGSVFRSTKRDVVVTELIIFITPRSVDDSKDEQHTEKQKKILQKAQEAGLSCDEEPDC
jgi:type IV pilus assembly protein PilQ